VDILGVIGDTTQVVNSRFIYMATDIMMAFPTIILVTIVVMLLGQGYLNHHNACGGVSAKIYSNGRARTLSTKEEEYLIAAKSIGIRIFGLSAPI